MNGVQQSRRRGFTLLELMVAMGVILILISILVPTIGVIRRKANEASTKAMLSALEAAIQQYYQKHNAYPGPIPDHKIGALATGNASPDDPDINQVQTAGNATLAHITGTENLVLGLLGGLRVLNNGAVEFDAALVGKGPLSLNLRNPSRNEALLDANIPLTRRDGVAANALTLGKYKDGAGEALDSNIPEILDRMPNPMPILYLRARKGSQGVVSTAGLTGAYDALGSQVATTGGGTLAATQFDLNHIVGYTSDLAGNGFIGEGKSIAARDYTNATKTPTGGKLPHGLLSVNESRVLEKNAPAGKTYQYPYDAFPYFVNRAIPPTDPMFLNGTGTPKKKDAYILISAGADRVYGTADDITSFGSVND